MVWILIDSRTRLILSFLARIFVETVLRLGPFLFSLGALRTCIEINDA